MLHLYEAQYTGAVWITGVTHLCEALTPAYTRPTANAASAGGGVHIGTEVFTGTGGVNTVNALACATDIMHASLCLPQFIWFLI